MDREKVAKELVRIAKEINAFSSNQFLVTDSKGYVEFLYDPFKSTVEIGIGGEWWGGKVKLGTVMYRHRKESVDPEYKPVFLTTKFHSGMSMMVFEIQGGFLESGESVTFHLKIK